MVSGVLCLFVDWQRALTDFLRQERPTYADLGRTLLGCVSVLGTPLGLFYQRYCDHVQPPPATEAYHQRRGDLLPIHLTYRPTARWTTTSLERNPSPLLARKETYWPASVLITLATPWSTWKTLWPKRFSPLGRSQEKRGSGASDEGTDGPKALHPPTLPLRKGHW